MRDQKRIEEVAALLGGCGKVLLVSHVNPDGDALGTTLGLAGGLRALDTEVRMINVSGVPEAFSWLPGSEEIATEIPEGWDYDAVVLLDCGGFDRTEFNAEAFNPAARVIVIDHHPGEGIPGALNLIDTSAAAASLVAFEVLDALGAHISTEAATALYFALHTDTGGFRFSNTDARTFYFAAELTRLGANPARVAAMILDREKAAKMKLLGLALSTLTLSPCGRIADIVVTNEMFKATGTSGEDTDGFVNYPRSIAGVEVAVLMKQRDDGAYRLGLRSSGEVDVSAIARLYGGGGHAKASGATLEGDPDSIRAEILGHVLAALEG